LIQKYKTELAL